MKTTDYVIDIVYSLLGSITVPKYRNTKPTKSTATEYIVINTLPINAQTLQKCYVNVNYHVKDIDGGTSTGLIPDDIKLAAGTALVMAALEKVSTTVFLIDFESQETIREEQLGEHYSNLKFSLKNINT
uniref:Uncharacterized protein n=1 Tax=viral metagenome TaxID=1070528 RepID=A0A6M3JSN6_9ZZZZ